MDAAVLLRNYERLLVKLDSVCHKYGRNREDISLVAVSKFHPASAIAVIAEAGQKNFGENYLQEAMEKKRELAGAPFSSCLRWHMIGHLQTRKAKEAAGNFVLIHTLDSQKLANALERALVNKDAVQAVLIEVNIGDEPQKAGIASSGLNELAAYVFENCPHLDLRGLMCLPPVFDSGDAARPFFARLRELRDSLERELARSLPVLSMGMSGDFAAAIAEGATIVRIGTEIFGPRPYPKPGVSIYGSQR